MVKKVLVSALSLKLVDSDVNMVGRIEDIYGVTPIMRLGTLQRHLIRVTEDT